MTYEALQDYPVELRRAAAAVLRNRDDVVRQHWLEQASALLREFDEPRRGRFSDAFLRLLRPLAEELEAPELAPTSDHLLELAEEVHRLDIPYAKASLGLRILKRVLTQRLLDPPPLGQDTAALADLIETAIDEVRLQTSTFFSTLVQTRIRESEQLTRFLLNNIHDAVFLVELDTARIRMVNARAVKITGYTGDQLYRLRFHHLVDADRARDIDEALRRVVVSNTVQTADLHLLQADGQSRPVMMRFTLVSDPAAPWCAQVSVQTVSGEAAASAAQEQEAAYLRAFVADTADGVIVLDTQNRIQFWNKGAERIFGYGAAEVLNQPVDILFPADLADGGEASRLAEVVESEGYVRNYESRRRRKDGAEIEVSITRTGIFAPDTGQWVGSTAMVRDETEKRALSRETERKSKQLEIINRILETTSRSLDRDDTYRTIAAQMSSVLAVEAMTISAPQPDGESIRVRVLLGDAGLPYGSEGLVRRAETVRGRVMTTRQSMRVPDLARLEGAGADDRRLAEQHYRSMLITPLTYQDELIGTLDLLHHEPDFYGEDDRALLHQLGGHLAIALGNAQRYEEQRKRAAQFELITRVGAAAIANIGDVNRLLQSLCEHIQADFGYHDVAIYEIDDLANVFRLRAQAGGHRELLGEGFEQPLDVGVFGEVLRTRASYVVNDTFTDPLYYNAVPEAEPVRSELCVPIRLGPRVFGVLDVESLRTHDFDRVDRSGMDALASILARCMEADENLRHTRMLQAMRHNIMEAVPSALLLLDDELRVMFVNKRYCEFFGQQVEDIMHRPATEIFPPDLLSESHFAELVEQLKHDHQPIDKREVRYFDFEGSERHADVRLRIVTEYETSIIVMIHDATPRMKRIFQLSLLREIGEEMQRTLNLDRLLRAILTCITAGPGLGFNRAALFLVGGEQTELIESMTVGPASHEEAARIWHSLGHKTSLRDFFEEYDRFHEESGRMVGPLHHAPVTIPLPAADDEFMQRWHAPLMVRHDDDPHALVQALRAYSGAPELIVVPLISQQTMIGVVVADNLFSGQPITHDNIHMLRTFASQAGLAIANAQAFAELERSLEELRKAQEQLRQAEQLAGIGSAAAAVAHEIRNPLVSIGGFARRLQAEAEDPAYVRDRSGIIIREVARLEQILRNVADFTAPGAPVFAVGQVNEVVREVISLCQEEFSHRRVTLRLELDPELPSIPIDGDKIKQVVLNLVRNGLQAIGADGELVVGTLALSDEKRVEIRVTDSGPGIPADRLEEIFNPFFTNKADGTGLGLAVSRKIVVDHSGSLTAQSPENQGATFVVRLPLDQPETAVVVEPVIVRQA